jgi:hypothetical protein
MTREEKNALECLYNCLECGFQAEIRKNGDISCSNSRCGLYDAQIPPLVWNSLMLRVSVEQVKAAVSRITALTGSACVPPEDADLAPVVRLLERRHGLMSSQTQLLVQAIGDSITAALCRRPVSVRISAVHDEDEYRIIALKPGQE